ncbi:Hypothetical predicted protein [Marmota monax]|uniref:Uncharacterized protein n=1 Tax=Marmota monax TaxID=9995 RepID=A0A5E4A4I2_MARMO|nr:hypothetical protein GHT09_006591 [Marmota monax]VTJ51622.1 Hypothetical predicted protein [Marmota monax]
MLNVVSSEPISRDTERSCVLRGSCTHCALRKAPQVKGQSYEELRGLEFSHTGVVVQSEAMDLSQRISQFHATKALFNGTFIFLLFLFLHLSDPKAPLCHRNGAIQPLSHVTGQGAKKSLEASGVKQDTKEVVGNKASALPWTESSRKSGQLSSSSRMSFTNAKMCWTLKNKVLWLHCTE